MEKLIEKARVTFRRRHDLYIEICDADTLIIRRLAFLPRVVSSGYFHSCISRTANFSAQLLQIGSVVVNAFHGKRHSLGARLKISALFHMK